MNEESQNSGIEPELEARVVALALGEASDFEREELNRQIERRPELAAFMLRMQKIHGLLQDVGVGEFQAPDDDWKLPTDRRNTVLAVIRGEATVQPAVQKVDQSVQIQVPVRRRWQWNLTRVAAVVCVAGFIGVMALQPFYMDERAASEYFYEMAKGDANSVLWGRANSVPVSAGRGRGIESSAPGMSQHVVTLSDGRSESFEREPGSTDADVPLYVVDLDYKKSSETALSAIQGTLNSGATVSNNGDLTDDVQSVVSSLETTVPEETVAQHGASTLEKEGRSTATFDVGAVSSPPAVDPNVLIAGNSAAITYSGVGNDDRDGVADFKPAAPDKGEVAFPDSVDSWGDVSDSAPAGTVRLRVNAPDGDSVLLGGIKLPSPGESAPTSDGIETSTPQIIIGNEEEVVGETSLELAMSDLPFQLPDLQQQQGQRESLNRNAPGADFSKDKAGVGAAGDKTDGEQFGKEAEPMDSLSLAGTAVDSPMADKNLNGLLSEADNGLGTAPQDSDRFGREGFGGDFGAIGSDRPSVLFGNLNLEMPSDAKGDADQIPEGITNFDSIGLGKSSQAEDSGRGSMARTKSAEDSAGKQSSESLQEAITQPGDEKSGGKGFVDGRAGGEPSGSTSQPMKLYGEDPKSGQTGDAGNATEEFEQKAKRGGTVSSGGVTPDNGRGVDPDFDIHDSGTSTETPAFGSRQLSIPGAIAGGGDGIQDNRVTERTRSLAPLVAADGLPPTTFYVYGFNDAPLSLESLPSKQKEQQGESRRQSGELANLWSIERYDRDPRTLKELGESMKKPAAKTVAPSVGLNETTAAAEAFSTFSLHVSDVSFKLAAAALARGEWPEAAKIRIEEFVNAFDYGDPLPGRGEKVACIVEQSIHPFVQQRNLLRVSMRTAAKGRASSTPLRLTFLLDNSGSMERTDRQETVRRAFALLSQQLSLIDQVTLISFARQPRLLAEKVSGAASGQLVKLIDELPSEGGTNIEAALQLAFEKATEQQTAGAQNRIILLTDGAVNLGDADPESLSRMVTTMRDAGIAFDAAGISAEGLNDDVLEALTRKGDGRYYLLDSLESADDGFVRQIAGALRPSASNVKVQVEFNPKRVGSYKLLGFEKHILKQEDFHNDTVDAAELAAAEAGVAMYQFEAKPDGQGDVGSVSVRFRDLSTGQMIENRWPIPYEADAPRPELAAPSLRIAASAALLAAKLRGEPLGETVDLQTLSHLISGLPEQDRNDLRVQQLQQMIGQARQMSGK